MRTPKFHPYKYFDSIIDDLKNTENVWNNSDESQKYNHLNIRINIPRYENISISGEVSQVNEIEKGSTSEDVYTNIKDRLFGKYDHGDKNKMNQVQSKSNIITINLMSDDEDDNTCVRHIRNTSPNTNLRDKRTSSSSNIGSCSEDYYYYNDKNMEDDEDACIPLDKDEFMNGNKNNNNSSSLATLLLENEIPRNSIDNIMEDVVSKGTSKGKQIIGSSVSTNSNENTSSNDDIQETEECEIEVIKSSNNRFEKKIKEKLVRDKRSALYRTPIVKESLIVEDERKDPKNVFEKELINCKAPLRNSRSRVIFVKKLSTPKKSTIKKGKHTEEYDNNDDDEIEVITNQTVNLICPVTLDYLNIPCIGIHCTNHSYIEYEAMKDYFKESVGFCRTCNNYKYDKDCKKINFNKNVWINFALKSILDKYKTCFEKLGMERIPMTNKEYIVPKEVIDLYDKQKDQNK